jgi:hypothetical protein
MTPLDFIGTGFVEQKLVFYSIENSSFDVPVMSHQH